MKVNMKNKKGFIAIETIITAGLMIALAGFGLDNYLGIAIDVSNHADGLVNAVNSITIL
jgi:hypothetical protein